MDYGGQKGVANLRLRERPRWLRFDPTLLIAILTAALIWGLLAWQFLDFLHR